MLGNYFTDESKVLWKDTGFVREAMKYIKNSNYLGGYIISGTPTDGQVPTYDSGTDTITWETAGGGGGGTVTSISSGEGLLTTNESIEGDPITTFGSIKLNLFSGLSPALEDNNDGTSQITVSCPSCTATSVVLLTGHAPSLIRSDEWSTLSVLPTTGSFTIYAGLNSSALADTRQVYYTVIKY